MLYSAFRFLAVMLSVCVIFAAAFLPTIWLVDEIVVSGRVESAPVKGSIRVQLLYPNHPNHKAGDSAEVTLERGSFRLEIPDSYAESRSCTDWYVPGKVRPQTKNCGRDPNRS
jgi:hypothetical protein